MQRICKNKPTQMQTLVLLSNTSFVIFSEIISVGVLIWVSPPYVQWEHLGSFLGTRNANLPFLMEN
jgi:hypothetical protein